MALEGKLALKGRPLQIVAAPPGFPLSSRRSGGPDDALLVFVHDRAELDRHQQQIVRTAGVDQLTWVAYPKAGQLGTDLTRGRLAAALAPFGIQPVTQIALDPVWSALRFRPSTTP